MTATDYIILALLFIIGFLIVAFIHLIIPICFAISKKTYPKKSYG